MGGEESHQGAAGGAVDAPWSMLFARAGANVTLLALAGLLLFSAWGSVGHMPRTLVVANALAIVGTGLVTAYAWMWAGGVLGGAVDTQARVTALLSLTSGRMVAAEAGMAWLTTWALFLARRPSLAAVPALLAVGLGGMAGHPASYTPLVASPLGAIHSIAAAVWVGGLLFLVTELGSSAYVDSARRVSRAALTCVILIATTGAIQSLLVLGSVPLPTGSAYERVLLMKIAGFAGLIAFGAYHRKRLVPSASAEDGASQLAGSVGREIILAAGVIGLAAILSHIPPPP
jgi:putative copper resistance protein D